MLELNTWYQFLGSKKDPKMACKSAIAFCQHSASEQARIAALKLMASFCTFCPFIFSRNAKAWLQLESYSVYRTCGRVCHTSVAQIYIYIYTSLGEGVQQSIVMVNICLANDVSPHTFDVETRVVTLTCWHIWLRGLFSIFLRENWDFTPSLKNAPWKLDCFSPSSG